MPKYKWERIFELSVIGAVIFIGLVSLFYSWIDEAFNVNVNFYLLTAVAVVATFLIVYLINILDKG
jgi:hypothetical protein